MNDAILWVLLVACVAALVYVRCRPGMAYRKARRAMLEPLRAVAAKFGGEVVEKPRVCFVRTPDFTVALVPDEDHDLEPGVRYHVRFEAPILSPQFLEVWPRGSRFAPMRLTVAREVLLAAPEFEQYFMLRADDAGFARGVLTPALREKIYKVWSLGGGGYARVDLFPHKLAVQKEEPLSALYLGAFVEKCIELRAEMEVSVRDQEGVQWLDAPARDLTVTCPICGSKGAENWVKCLRCKTSHHRDCWEWNAGCSMFACGESRFELT